MEFPRFCGVLITCDASDQDSAKSGEFQHCEIAALEVSLRWLFATSWEHWGSWRSDASGSGAGCPRPLTETCS